MRPALSVLSRVRCLPTPALLARNKPATATFSNTIARIPDSVRESIREEKHRIIINASKGCNTGVASTHSANGAAQMTLLDVAVEEAAHEAKMIAEKAKHIAELIAKATAAGSRAIMERGGVWSVHYVAEAEAEAARKKLIIENLPLPTVEYYKPLNNSPASTKK